MTINTELAFVERAWTGVETSFATGFPVRDRAHVGVVFRNPGGARTTLVLDTHFAVTVDPATRIATVTPVALPTAPGTLEISRRTPATQPVDFRDNSLYPQQVHEDLADNEAMRDAELRAQVDRALTGLTDLGNAVATATAAATTSTTQAGVSTTQAGISTTKAAEATAAAALAQQLATIVETIKTASYAVTNDDRNKRIVGNSAAALTFTMPDLATATAGIPFHFKNIGTAPVTLETFETDGSETFDENGGISLVMDPLDVVVAWKAGTVWRTLIARAQDRLDGEASLASAATVDLGAVNSARVVITGTTTITSFGTRRRRQKWVRFAGALTLTHNATTLVLPTGASIVTAAGDTALFASDTAGNWRCLAYQRASGAPLVAGGFTGAAADDGKVLYWDHASGLTKTAWAHPRAPYADLRDFLPSGFTERTGVGTGTDVRPYIEPACDAIRARYSTGRGRLLMPNGTWLLNAALDPAKVSGVSIESEGGSQACRWVYNNASGTAIRFSAASAYTGGGLHGIACLLEDGIGNSNAEFLRLEGDATNMPDQFRFSDLYITALGSSYWFNALVMNGIPRTSPQGIRLVDARNIQLFRSRNAAGQFYNPVGFTIENLGSYSGTGGGNDIYFGGGGASNTNATQLDAQGVWCSGTLVLTNMSRFRLFGTATIVSTNSTCTYHTGTIFAPTLSGTLGTPGNLTVIA